MIDRTISEAAHRGGSHHTHHHDLGALSLETPGRRRMRGLSGRDGGPTDHGHSGRRARPADFERRDDRRGHAGHGGPFRGHGARHQMRRGAIRDAILGLLAESPMHGYQVMQELADRSGGRWNPSAGSVYPTLQQLEDEGLVVAEDRDGRKTFALTDTGRAAAMAIPADPAWALGEARTDLRLLARELGIAAIQVARVGSPAANDAARKLLTDARRDLYRLLAEDDTTTA